MKIQNLTTLTLIIGMAQIISQNAAMAQKTVNGRFSTSVTLTGQELGGFNVSAIVQPTTSTPTPTTEEEYNPAAGQNLQGSSVSQPLETTQQSLMGSASSQRAVPGESTQQTNLLSTQSTGQSTTGSSYSPTGGSQTTISQIQVQVPSIQGIQRTGPNIQDKLDQYFREIEAALSVNQTPVASADLVKDAVRNLFGAIARTGATSNSGNSEVKDAYSYVTQTIKDQLKSPGADTVSFLIRQAESSVNAR